jgi:hypothetical protein
MPKEATGKMATKVVVDILSRHFADIAADNDVLEYPQILYKNSKGFAINNKSDLDRLIKKTINETVGSEMATIYVLNKIADAALELEFDGEKSSLPVLFTISDEGEVDSILAGQKRMSLAPFLLTSGEVSDKFESKVLAAVETVDKESVLNALKTVKSNLKNTKRRK